MDKTTGDYLSESLGNTGKRCETKANIGSRLFSNEEKGAKDDEQHNAVRCIACGQNADISYCAEHDPAKLIGEKRLEFEAVAKNISGITNFSDAAEVSKALINLAIRSGNKAEMTRALAAQQMIALHARTFIVKQKEEHEEFKEIEELMRNDE